MITRRALLTAALAAPLIGRPERRPPKPVIVRAIAPITVSAPPALFVAAHPDDETLAMGVTIAEHVAAGQDVHILWLSRGAASAARNAINGVTTSAWWGVKHNPAVEGYAPLTAAEFGAARVTEASNAARCYGSVTIHEAGLADGQITQADAEDAIATVANKIAPQGAVRLKTHSHMVDNHPDHLAAGNAVLALGDADPGRFGDRRYYVLPWYWADPRLAQVTWSWDNPANGQITARVVNACRAFGAWSPPRTYAIGQHSVPDLFAELTAQPRSMQHL